MEEDQSLKICMRDVNPHIVCSLCAGYFIDATTITECLHTYCKSCIVKYLQSSKCCPQCSVKVHETQPLFHLRADRTMQDIVFKLVPGLFENEEKRRSEFYKSRGDLNPKKDKEAATQGENPSGPRLSSIINKPQGYKYRYDEQICLCLERYSIQSIQHYGKRFQLQNLDKKFIRCSIRVLIAHIKAMLHKKLNLPATLEFDVLCEDEDLADEMSLKQIYLMNWYEKETPMMLYYRFREGKT